MSEISKVFFSMIQPGTFFNFQGWKMLKTKNYRGFNAVMIESNNPELVHDCAGQHLIILDNDEVEVIKQ